MVYTKEGPRYLVNTENRVTEAKHDSAKAAIALALYICFAIVFRVWDMSFMPESERCILSLVCAGFAGYYFAKCLANIYVWKNFKSLLSEMKKDLEGEVNCDKEADVSSE